MAETSISDDDLAKWPVTAHFFPLPDRGYFSMIPGPGWWIAQLYWDGEPATMEFPDIQAFYAFCREKGVRIPWSDSTKTS
jgi:hypothetical protein